MASVKKKVLRFKNTPVKKDVKEKKVTKKKEVSLPSQATDMIAQNTIVDMKEEVTTTIVKPAENIVPETKVTETVQKTTESRSFVANPSTDTFLVSAFDRSRVSKDYFPRISRVITEKWFLIGLVCGILLVGIVIVAGNIQENIKERKSLEQKRETIKKEITYWQENARKYPGYRDAYFQLALLEYQLGDAQSSQSYLNKVESLDPNFQEAYKLEKILKGN